MMDFSKRYNREEFVKFLQNDFLPEDDFLTETTEAKIQQETKYIKGITKLGASPSLRLAVYEARHTSTHDARVGLSKEIFRFMANKRERKALVLFVPEGNDANYRLSLISIDLVENEDGNVKRTYSNPRRYSYYLGEGIPCRTPNDFLQKTGRVKNVEDLAERFSVEPISKEFFNKYREHYADIVCYITGKRYVKEKGKWVEKTIQEPCHEIFDQFANVYENPEKTVRDYIKKLFGRLVFLQFLQKKGWLGVPADCEDWTGGDKRFLQNKFSEFKDKDNFIDGFLEPLFNDLNTERPGDRASSAVGKNIKIPYLNGGLFQLDEEDCTEVRLPQKYLGGLLDIFEQYNFTIDENDPNDAQIGVDPEMLGRVFENLLEDNKDKGAFYTPKEIVQYMCRESLIAYLQTGMTDDIEKETVRQFVLTHDATALDGMAENINEKLCCVKICDPAIGSGAFPMGLLRELYQCRCAIRPDFEEKSAADIKRHIIQNSIYGVDIEKGAVDIARLRFWLSLIVEEETPRHLPNLDFKIMQGNSLLEQYKGVDLSKMTELKVEKQGGTQLTWLEEGLDYYRLDLRKKLNEYYDCADHKRKETLKQEIIKNVKIQLKEQNLNVDFGDLDLSANDQFTLWHTWFYDVFSQGGFDIVIANPPFVDAKRLKKIAQSLKQFEVYNGSADLYTYFYEFALKILTNSGCLTFITSNKWIRSEYGRNLRKLFLKNEIVQLIDFGRNRLFGATVDSNIIVIKKGNQRKQPQLFYFDEETKGCTLLEMLPSGYVKDVVLTENSWLLKAGENDLLKSKIESHGIPLKEFDVNIYRGILTGFNKAYHIDWEEKERLVQLDAKNASIIKPLICGGNTEKYFCNPPTLWMINIHNGIKGKGVDPIDITDYPIIKHKLDAYFGELSKRNDKGYTVYNLRNCAYLKEFDKEKIIWQAISKRIAFSYDPKGLYYCDVTTYFMTGNNLKYILAILNSKLFEYALLKIYLEGDTFKSKNTIIQNYPIPKVSKKEEQLITEIVDEITLAKSLNSSIDISTLETRIDFYVYYLYGLTYDEVLIVDPETPITREEYESYNH